MSPQGSAVVSSSLLLPLHEPWCRFTPTVLGHVLSSRNVLGPSRSCRYAYVEYLGMRTMILSLQACLWAPKEEGLGFQFALEDT